MSNGEAFFEGYTNTIQSLSNQNAAGCDSLVDVQISIEESASALITGDYCSNYVFEVNGSIYDINNQSGTEILENQSQNGCDSIVEINLSFNATPVDSVFNFSTCDDDFSVTIGGDVYNSTNTSGTTTLLASSAEFCDTMIQVEIVFGELGVEALEIDGGCDNTENGTLILESSNGTLPFNLLYNGNNALVFSLPFELELPIGSGEISITDDDGCTTILDYELFSGSGGNFELINDQNELEIIGGEPDSILWSPTNGLSCTTCINPIATPDVTTTYTAIVYYGDSCEVILSTEVFVVDDTPDYIFPSVFSPNGDNMNENFVLTITDGAVGVPVSLRVFDRWGNLVYNGSGQDILTTGWDGTFNNNRVNSGVYVYQLAVQENEDTVYIYGDVTVVR